MSLQGPIVVIAEKPAGGLVQALTAAGAFPVVEARWVEAAKGLASLKPAGVVVAETQSPDPRPPSISNSPPPSRSCRWWHSSAMMPSSHSPMLSPLQRTHRQSG